MAAYQARVISIQECGEALSGSQPFPHNLCLLKGLSTSVMIVCGVIRQDHYFENDLAVSDEPDHTASKYRNTNSYP